MCREATRYAVKTAAENGVMLSFDPNLRESLWKSLDDAGIEILYGLSKCNILKISDYELAFLCGKSVDYNNAMQEIMDEHKNIRIAFLTCGAQGARAYYKGSIVKAAAPNIKAIDTTGAGDTFTGCALNYILENGIDTLSEHNLKEMLTFANAGAALVTTKKGALKAMPTMAEIRNLIS